MLSHPNLKNGFTTKGKTSATCNFVFGGSRGAQCQVCQGCEGVQVLGNDCSMSQTRVTSSIQTPGNSFV